MAHWLFVLVLATLFNSSFQQASRIRLVGGSGPHEGRVEVRPPNSYSWGTVCDDSFGMNDAIVVCRMLGYTGASAYHSSVYYGQGSGNIYMDDLRCTGTESSLFDCSYRGWGVHNCNHDDDVGVVCYSSSGCPTVRISGSSSVQSSRMTTYDMTGQLRNGRPVYKSSRGDYLYYYTRGRIRWYVGDTLGGTVVGLYVADDTSIYAEDITGTWYLYDGTDFRPYSLVRVNCVTNTIRLVGGSEPHEGRVEVRPPNSYSWGTVCDDSFGMDDARVACRMLEYTGASAYHGSAYYGRGSGNIYMDDLRCTGTESSLFACSYRGWGVHNCDHGEDVGVVCYSTSGLSTGAIIGISVGVVAAVVLIIVICCCCCCKKSAPVATTSPSSPPAGTANPAFTPPPAGPPPAYSPPVQPPPDGLVFVRVVRIQ